MFKGFIESLSPSFVRLFAVLIVLVVVVLDVVAVVLRGERCALLRQPHCRENELGTAKSRHASRKRPAACSPWN
jgi:hypothetical protein